MSGETVSSKSQIEIDVSAFGDTERKLPAHDP